MRTVVLAVLFAVVTLAPAVGQNTPPVPAEPANLAELAAAANREGRLDISMGGTFGGTAGAKFVQDRLNAEYHINLTIHYSPDTSGTAFAQQLAQEVKAGQPASSDIMAVAYSSAMAPYLETVDWHKYVPGLPEGAMLYNRRAVQVLTALIAFEYNTKLVPPNVAPKSFADLLQPQWKGKIASSVYQGTFMNYLGLPSVFGHQGMLDYVRKFAAQVSGLMTCAEEDRVVSGEFAIFGLDCGDHEARLRQRKGEPIGTMYPREATQLSYVASGIPLTAAHPNAAKLYLAFLLSREGQAFLWQMEATDNDKLPGSHMAQVMADLRRHGVKFVEGNQGTGLDITHPELIDYAKEAGAIINNGR